MRSKQILEFEASVGTVAVIQADYHSDVLRIEEPVFQRMVFEYKQSHPEFFEKPEAPWEPPCSPVAKEQQR